MIRVQCPRCQTKFTTSDANAGKTGQCPKCGNPIKVSAAGSAASRPSVGAAAGEASAPPATSDAAVAPAAASSDSALGEARRHAAQATAAGAARPAATSARPAPRPQAQRRPRPPAEAKPAPATAAPPAEKTAALPTGKSKTVALVLAIFLGALGTHRFYMGAWGWGLVILGLNLTCIGGGVFALIDAIKLAVMDKDDFQERYAETAVRPFTF